MHDDESNPVPALPVPARALGLLELPLALSSIGREGESGKNVLFDSIWPPRCAAGAGTEGEGEDEEEEDDIEALGAAEALALPKKIFITDLTGAKFITLLNMLVECVDSATSIGEATCAVDEEEDEDEDDDDDDENDAV